jgi:hypothetical protein
MGVHNKLMQLVYTPRKGGQNILKRVNLHLSDRQIEQLKKLSKKLGISFAELIRRGMDEYLEKKRHEEKIK